jgi:hypothetical protein
MGRSNIRRGEGTAGVVPRRSWTALLAATTLGVAGASVVHADIQSHARLDETRTYRLVVQSYDHAAAESEGERPNASLQRQVTAAELRAGIRVGLLEFRQRDDSGADSDAPGNGAPVVLAWVEEGTADLELDGLRARPQPGSLRGAATATDADGTVRISVGRS